MAAGISPKTASSLWKEFKEFAIKGNAIDMAVGIIIGAAFGTIVSSLVKDIIMPPIGLVLGQVDFSDMFILLKRGTDGAAKYASLNAARNVGAITVNLGVFINAVISFLFTAFAVFLMVRLLNRFKRQEKDSDAAPTAKDCPRCLMTIPLKASRCPHCTSDLVVSI
jgi:large conductance mechanosensitive channel